MIVRRCFPCYGPARKRARQSRVSLSMSMLSAWKQTRWCTDLKFLQRLRQTRLETSNRKSGTRLIKIASAPSPPKFVSELAMYHGLRKRGTSYSFPGAQGTSLLFVEAGHVMSSREGAVN